MYSNNEFHKFDANEFRFKTSLLSKYYLYYIKAQGNKMKNTRKCKKSNNKIPQWQNPTHF